MYIIYKLICPIINVPVYIGQTSKTLKLRLQYHLNVKTNDKSNKANWIREIKSKGLKPLIEQIETCYLDADIKETFWINHYNELYILLNSQSGGKNNFTIIHELKEKFSNINSGTNNPNYGKDVKQSTKDKIGLIHKGKVTTIQTIEKMRTVKRTNSRPIIIDNIEYLGISDASRKLNICTSTIERRLKSENFTNYMYKY